MSVQTQINRIKAARDNIAAKIRARGVSVPTDTKLDELPDFVDDIPSGVELPSLTNEGTAADLLSGKQLIDSDGEVVTGTIPTKTSSNLTASGATVTVPAGYYASQATKTISSGSAKTPTTTVTKNPTISVSSSGLITASVSGTQNVTPTVTAGYVSSGTAGTITVSGSATKQLTVQAAQTITPGTSNKTIASGRYLTGTQTIKGDSNLVAGNIKSGVSIFGVTGTYEGSGGGGSGGGSVETCTVTVDNMDCQNMQMVATLVIDGIETIYTTEGDQNAHNYPPITLNNVKCGSAIVVEIPGSIVALCDVFIEADYDDAVVKMYTSSNEDRTDYYTNTFVFRAPTVANANSTIFIM